MATSNKNGSDWNDKWSERRSWIENDDIMNHKFILVESFPWMFLYFWFAGVVLISLQLFGMRNTIVLCGWLYVFFRTYIQIAVLVAFENSMKRISWSWRFSFFSRQLCVHIMCSYLFEAISLISTVQARLCDKRQLSE